MHPEFWHQRWASNQIGFHEPAANPLLVKHFDKLKLPHGSRIFLPLCGKTLDIAWLLAQGYQVVGAELSKLAIEQLFEELNVKPVITTVGKLEHFHAHKVDIFVGDIFNITPSMVGKIDANYDRAALVALPSDMRKRYTRHLIDLTHAAPQLLICFEFDQSLAEGPPFSIIKNEVKEHYSNIYQINMLEEVPSKLKGQHEALEVVWLLNR